MAKDDARIEVTKEDQRRINKFSRLTARVNDLEAQVKAKKKFLEDVDDAENEVMISDDETFRMVIGDCFVHLEKDDAGEALEATGKDSRTDIKSLESEIKDIRGQLIELKANLYAKFKDTIQLEE